jgi:Fe-S-cluster containining protein
VPEDPKDSSPHVCVRCAARGTSCCVSVEGVSGPPVTPGDLARISALTGLAPDQFLTARAVDSIEQAAWEEDDPATRGLVQNGRVRSLLRRGSACFFLGEQGCKLGEARPLLCHRFPFVRHGSRIEVKPGGTCLAVEEGKDLSGLLISLGTSRKRLAEVDYMLRRELNSGSENR